MQFKIQKKLIFIISFFSLIFNIASASSFYEKIRDIRVEINRDNLSGAIKLLEEIKIENELEQDEIYILYGDIYLKINKPKKAEEFYEKAFFTTNKYIDTPQGIFELKFFFHSGIKSYLGNNLSSVRVKNMIKEVVAEEDAYSPYTDDQMVQVLMRKNAKIARRTITKYRKELNIPPASKRKKFF